MNCNNVNVEPIIIGGGDGSTAYDAFGSIVAKNVSWLSRPAVC